MDERMLAAAANLESKLREWAGVDGPQIGHHSQNVAVRAAAAKAEQARAVEIADRIAGLCASPDALETYLIGEELHHATANMDAYQLVGVRRACKAAFDAAIARRNDREGYRLGENGFRERRLPTGEWQTY